MLNIGSFVVVVTLAALLAQHSEGTCETRATAVVPWYRAIQPASQGYGTFLVQTQAGMQSTLITYTYAGLVGYIYSSLSVTNGATININSQKHFYTANSTEYLALTTGSYTFNAEGTPGYCSTVYGKGLCPVYHSWNPTLFAQWITTNYLEMVYQQSQGYNYMDIMCYLPCNAWNFSKYLTIIKL